MMKSSNRSDQGESDKMCVQNQRDKIETVVNLYRSVFTDSRHLEDIINVQRIESPNVRQKDRMKTMSVAVVMCLNVGCDPPDVCKPNPCAVHQCWIDPFTLPQSKASETIAKELVKQYERWQPRARCKFLPDPTIEDVKKLTTALRRSSKEERVLFHYNGHGVPQPTSNGEIWVFNKNFTQYIPLSLYDLQQWMGNPSIYVFDCSNGGVIAETFMQIADQHRRDYDLNHGIVPQQNGEFAGDYIHRSEYPPNFYNFILLIACDKNEMLPFHEGMPADLFTSCLTTPIKTFIVWFLKTGKSPPDISPDIVDNIPGSLTDRKTILGELNWIFTAITDTIAWNTLPKDLFQRLFRQDLLVASLFRNFLLAQRIMRSYDCNPISFPEIKSVHYHPLWASWDLAVSKCLSQLSELRRSEVTTIEKVPYSQNQFFTEQLTAFQVWLKLESISQTSVPEQLPIILQVLLSQAHRSRALDLLGNFLNLGPAAVDHALSVGIFPYVLKLLQTNAREVKPFLVFIWAKILAIAEPYQIELVRENAHLYFMNVLADSQISINHQIMSAFVLSVVVRRFQGGQNIAVKSGSSNPSGSLIDICIQLLMEHQNGHPNLRKWLLICLGNVWENNEDVRWLATRNSVYEKIFAYLEDPVPEVRTAAVFALGTFINSVATRNDHANEIDIQIVLTLIQKVANDSSPLVRREFLVTLQWFVLIFEKAFHSVLHKREGMEQNAALLSSSSANQSPKNSIAQPNNSHNVTNISIDSNGSSPNFLMTAIRKMSSVREPRLTSGITSNISKLLPLPVSITVPSNLSSVGQGSPNQFTPPGSNSLRYTNSLKSLADHKVGITNIYSRVWQMLETLCHDPDPSVSKMAYTIYKDVLDRFHMKDNLSMSSQSNSPSNRHDFIDSHESGRTSSRNSIHVDNFRMASRRSISVASYSGGGNSSFVHPAPKRSMFWKEPQLQEEQRPSEHLLTTSNVVHPENSGYFSHQMPANSHSFSEQGVSVYPRESLIKTSFVDWCTTHFSKPCLHFGGCDCTCTNFDSFKTDLSQEWRTKTLFEYYRKAQNKLEHSPVLETKIVSSRKTLEANNLIFHPFEKTVVYSTLNDIHAWDISNDDCRLFSNEHSSRITDIKLINTHEESLTMVATEGGIIKVWRNMVPTTFSSLCPSDFDELDKPVLATAFSMFDDQNQQHPTKLCWQQSRNRLIAGGGHRVVRLWDANCERKIRDISPEMDTVNTIATDGGYMICLGSEDGFVKLFDERTQSSRPVFSIKQHNSPVVGANIWPDNATSGSVNVVSGIGDGHIFWYDRRYAARPVRSESGYGAPMTSMAFHDNIDVFACAFGKDSDLRIFTLDTLKGPSIKLYNEIKHLNFHPLKSKLSLITTDGTIRIMKMNLLSFSV